MAHKKMKPAHTVRYTSGTKATCPYCRYVNDARHVDYCRHARHINVQQQTFKPHKWIFRRDS